MERPEEEKFKVWPTRADQTAFATAITAGSVRAVNAHELSPTSNLLAAYRFFHEPISALVSFRSISTYGSEKCVSVA
jgi:hypothetical protein